MKIAGYLKTSLIEWPGKVVSVIFVPGCNFRCPFCHNADLVDSQTIRKLKNVGEESVFDDLNKKKKWVDGVVITGGEPLVQADIKEFLEKLKKLDLETMIETNGAMTSVLRGLVVNGLIDYVALDFKAPMNEAFGKVVGDENFDYRNILRSIRTLLRLKLPFELRTTVVPGIHDEEALVRMASDLRRVADRHPRESIGWFWQNFQPKNCLDPGFRKRKPYSQGKLKRLYDMAKKGYPMIELKTS